MDYEFVALSHPEEYPMGSGRLVSSKGLDIEVSQYDDYFEESQVEYTHALHSIIKERGSYFVGPMARYNLNSKKLSQRTQELVRKVGLTDECRNPFKSIIVRSLEVHQAYDEAIEILSGYDDSWDPVFKVEVKAGTGFACTEAPRGILYHRYRVGADGVIQDAKIVPPTSQNQKTIESDLHALVKRSGVSSTQALKHQCEQAIRNYDPCISCATHFLRMEIQDE